MKVWAAKITPSSSEGRGRGYIFFFARLSSSLAAVPPPLPAHTRQIKGGSKIGLEREKEILGRNACKRKNKNVWTDREDNEGRSCQVDV